MQEVFDRRRKREIYAICRNCVIDRGHFGYAGGTWWGENKMKLEGVGLALHSLL